jgi:hypothetical protein
MEVSTVGDEAGWGSCLKLLRGSEAPFPPPTSRTKGSLQGQGEQRSSFVFPNMSRTLTFSDFKKPIVKQNKSI